MLAIFPFHAMLRRHLVTEFTRGNIKGRMVRLAPKLLVSSDDDYEYRLVLSKRDQWNWKEIGEVELSDARSIQSVLRDAEAYLNGVLNG